MTSAQLGAGGKKEAFHGPDTKHQKRPLAMQGKIKTFSADKGFGFIKGDDEKDYFFHIGVSSFSVQ